MSGDHLFGYHATRHLLETAPERVLEVWAQQSRHDDKLAHLLTLAEQQGLTIHQALPKTLDKLAEGGVHQGIVVRYRPRKPMAEDILPDYIAALSEPPLILILDNVQDPRNLGACLRTADAVGVQLIITPKDRAAGLSPAVRKVATGAAETVPVVQVTNLARTLKLLKTLDIWIAGLDGDASDSLFSTTLPERLALVMGAEGQGLRRLTRENCDLLLNIPMHGMVESLNVSVAAGVCLYEALRQRTVS